MPVEPKTLQEAIIYFSDPDVCLEYVVAKRWPNGVICPTCGSSEVHFIPTRRLWECKGKHSKRQFSAKVGTICEDSALGLDKWLCAMWMIGSCKNGVSSYEIKRALGVTQKSAWFLLHRIRKAMHADDSRGKLTGEIEADETYIGGKVKNMHRRSPRRIRTVNSPSWGKAIVLGLLNRETGEVRAKVAPSRTKHDVHAHVNENVEPGSVLYTDEHHGYDNLPPEIVRQMVNHISAYVDGRIHVNSLENFWSLLKRTLGGTYVSVDPHHLFRYLDEQMFRYNKRRLTDGERLAIVTSQIVNRRLTYRELTGATQAESA
ncbi:MAG: IS1595 family transposase [Bryobacteraceae bacterium]